MDCPAEEQLVRIKLADLEDVRGLTFDLAGRTLIVYHIGSRQEISEALQSLNLGSHEVDHDAKSGELPPTKRRDEEQGPLIAALAINAILFVAEFVAGWFATSMGLVADSLDMLADATVYALSLAAVGATIRRKKDVARLSGYFQFALAVAGLVEVVRRFVVGGGVPDFTAMAGFASLALLGNVITLRILSRVRRDEAHLQASWIFTSNDIKVNLLVIASAAIVFLTASRVPDLVVGGVIFVIVARGARQILALSR